VGATGTLTVTFNDFTAAAVLRLGKYELVSGEDYAVGAGVPYIQSAGTATVVATPSTATLTIGGQTLIDAGGARASGSNDYDGTLGTEALIAANIVEAINDPANGFAAIATASDGGGGLIDLTAVPLGTAGDAVALVTSDAGDITVSGAFLTGGQDQTGQDQTAANIAAVIDVLPGFSAVSGAELVDITGPAGVDGNGVLFEAVYTGSVVNFTLAAVDGSILGTLANAEPFIGPPAIT
jgi:hypothetical protein